MEQLSKRLGMSPQPVRAGLKRLKAAGLVRETSPGRFRSRWAGKFYTFPGRLRDMSASLKTVQGYWDRMFKRKGTKMAERVELIRAEEGSIRGYMNGLSETLDAANTWATHSS